MRDASNVPEWMPSAKAVFDRIYREKAWHAEGVDALFYSGPGSDLPFAVPYSALVRRFAKDRNLRNIVDLGCGDFRVGRLIAQPPYTYVGIDVVEPLIRRNSELFTGPGVSFLCRDIALDELPTGELCLVREVFQHLSNRQIISALERMKAFKYCLITDRQPSADSVKSPNTDREQGEKARTALNSALLYDKPPFNCERVELLFDDPAPTAFTPDGRLRTYLITN